jgi:hypothetical protein
MGNFARFLLSSALLMRAQMGPDPVVGRFSAPPVTGRIGSGAAWRFGVATLVTLVASLVLPNAAMGQVDTTPPTLHALSCSPSAVDVTGGPQTVTCTATITDDLSGVSFAGVSFFLPADGGLPPPGFFAGLVPTSGDDYEGQAGFPQYIRPGTYAASASICDRVGNCLFLSDSDLRARGIEIAVEVNVNNPPDCSEVSTSQSRLWPPNHKYRRVSLGGASDPDGDALTLTVTGVTQDEPVRGRGDGNTSPDARAAGSSDKVLVRAERSGKGNGRVYRIAYEVSDGNGGSCSGTVTVGVPKNMGKDSVPVDSAPPSFDSLGP